MIALPLSILALAAGVYLLVKVKREFLGGIFEILSWLVILLSLVSIGFLGFKAVRHNGGEHCEKSGACRMEKEIIIKQDGDSHCNMNSSSSCTMGGCKMEGDSVVMDKEMCEKMMGKETCDAVCKERGRCVMSKEECMEMCHAAGKPCCAEKSEGACSMHKENCKGDCSGKCNGKCEKKCEGEKKECCKKKMLTICKSVTNNQFDIYLRATKFIDSDHPKVIEYAHAKTSAEKSDKQKVVDLYLAVRDEILYNPYNLILIPEEISASKTLARGTGYCIEKSLLLCAVGRIQNIPSRLGFSIVQNHLSTKKFVDMLRTDKFVFHGYNEFWIDDRWIKCTPAFNKTLCEKFGTNALDFDGEHDSIFQEFNGGKKYMNYLHEYGQFDDFPFDLFVEELKIHYPHLFDESNAEAFSWGE